MARIVKNLDSDQPKEIQLLQEYEVASKVRISPQRLRHWIQSSEMDTPKPSFKIGGTSYWTVDTLEAWKVLSDNYFAQRQSKSFTRAELVDFLLAQAKELELSASRAYRRSRYNSIGSVRERITKLEGVYEFVAKLGYSEDMDFYEAKIIEPKEKREEIDKLLALAKQHVKTTS